LCGKRKCSSYNDQRMVTSYTAEDIRALVEAGTALTSELALDCIRQKLVGVARSQAGARYAAISVLEEKGDIAEFVTSGITDEARARIGHIPYARSLRTRIGVELANKRTKG